MKQRKFKIGDVVVIRHLRSMPYNSALWEGGRKHLGKLAVISRIHKNDGYSWDYDIVLCDPTRTIYGVKESDIVKMPETNIPTRKVFDIVSI